MNDFESGISFSMSDQVWLSRGTRFFRFIFVISNNEKEFQILSDFTQIAICKHFKREGTSETNPLSVTLENIKGCINSGGEFATGPDGVTYSRMKSLGEKKVSDIRVTLNHSLEEGDIPEDWLDSKIGSYRTIKCRIQSANSLER